jgi:peptidoglycan/LPS O-acetylase OafA/YrhL
MALPSAPAAPRRDHALDGMRGIAALLVFFSHAGMMTWWPSPDGGAPTPVEFGLWHLGAPSVDLFFVLSGYVLTASLENVRLGGGAFAAFFARRWVRLMPVAWAGVILGLLVKTWIVPLQHAPLVGMLKMADPLDWQDVTGLATFMVPMPETERFDVPLWSLVMEMYASLLIPFVVAGLRSQGRFFLLPAFLTPAILWYMTDRLEFMTLPLFVIGVAIRTYVPAMPARSAAAGLVAALVLIFSRHIFGEIGFSHRYVSGCGAALAILSVHAGAARGFLTSRPIAWLGRISYPFYAVHYPLLLASTILLSARGVQTNLAAIAALPVALLAAALVQTAIERPSIRLSRRVGGVALSPSRP